MGLVKKFFAPLTNFLRIYRGLSQGTSEELGRSTHIREAAESMKKRHETLQDELANVQTSILNQLSSKIREAEALKKHMKAHDETLTKLIQDMGDPDSDKERVFYELQKMGYSLDGSANSIPKSEELLKQFENVTKIDKVVDLRGIVNQVSELGKESAILQQELAIFEESLSSNPNMKSAEAIEEAERLAIQKGLNPEAVKEFTDRIKAKWIKKL